MFGVNYEKLKTNLKLTVQRLKLIEKKKTENAKKSTKEIADYIQANKVDRARIKVEHIIREDYTVEGMEIVEMYNDLLLARFGVLQHVKSLEPELEECVSSILWASPRLEADCPELKVVSEQLALKFGKEYATSCKSNKISTVNQRLMQKLTEQAPSKLLVEKYLVEIAQSHKVPFKPDPELAVQDYEFFYNSLDNSQKLTKPSNNNNNGNGGSGNEGGSGGAGGASAISNVPSAPAMYPYPKISHIGFEQDPPQSKPKKKENKDEFKDEYKDFSLPDVPTNNDESTGSSSDDLLKRFENLKKK